MRAQRRERDTACRSAPGATQPNLVALRSGEQMDVLVLVRNTRCSAQAITSPAASDNTCSIVARRPGSALAHATDTDLGGWNVRSKPATGTRSPNAGRRPNTVPMSAVCQSAQRPLQHLRRHHIPRPRRPGCRARRRVIPGRVDPDAQRGRPGSATPCRLSATSDPSSTPPTTTPCFRPRPSWPSHTGSRRGTPRSVVGRWGTATDRPAAAYSSTPSRQGHTMAIGA